MTLEEQVEYLKMEVDILKKVKALRKGWGELSDLKLLMNLEIIIQFWCYVIIWKYQEVVTINGLRPEERCTKTGMKS